MISSQAGRQIDLSDRQYEKEDSSIRTSLEFDSNVTLDREVQSAKDCEQITSSEAGRQIDLSDGQLETVELSI
jgi:hypothetical protein